MLRLVVGTIRCINKEYISNIILSKVKILL